jgi:hypothetical protein
MEGLLPLMYAPRLDWPFSEFTPSSAEPYVLAWRRSPLDQQDPPIRVYLFVQPVREPMLLLSIHTGDLSALTLTMPSQVLIPRSSVPGDQNAQQ